MKVNGVEIAKRLVGTYNQALVGECGVMGTGASTVLMLVEELSHAEAQVRKLSVKSEDVPVCCSYCGAEICKNKDWDPEVPKHMATCEKNPLARLFKWNAELRSHLASIKAEYEATALANGRLQAENARLKAALSAAHAAGELGGWEGCRPEDNCACCDAWRGAKELRDAAIALPV